MPTPLTGARDAFLRQFGAARHRELERPVIEARQLAQAGRHEPAVRAYREAVAQQPYNWFLLGEVAEFLTRRVGDYATGLEVARAAVALNPWYTASLWNVLGDALYWIERYGDAHEAYLQALRIHPDDPFTCLNLAFSHSELGRQREALEAIAAGLAADRSGAFLNSLLEKQQHILGRLRASWQEEREWLARRDQSQVPPGAPPSS